MLANAGLGIDRRVRCVHGGWSADRYALPSASWGLHAMEIVVGLVVLWVISIFVDGLSGTRPSAARSDHQKAPVERRGEMACVEAELARLRGEAGSPQGVVAPPSPQPTQSRPNSPTQRSRVSPNPQKGRKRLDERHTSRSTDQEGASKADERSPAAVAREKAGGLTAPTNITANLRDEALSAWDQWSQERTAFEVNPLDAEFEAARTLLREKGIRCFWHMTHADNLAGILGEGILSHSAAWQLRRVTDISDASVQKRRARSEPVYGRSLHDYAPLYVNARNPMLYRRKEIQDQICLIEVSIDVLRNSTDRAVVFTDGNAAADLTGFYSRLTDLKLLPWDVLCADYWTDFADGKRKRCAEVLVHPSVGPAYLGSVHCCSGSLVDRFGAEGINVVYDQSPFFS